MSHRIKKAAAVAVLGSALVAAPATAQTSNPTIVVKGGTVMRPGKAIIDNMRFTPLRKLVKSGSTLTINNRTASPHTLSVVKAADLPKNAAQMERFFESPLMGQFMQAHQVDPENEDAPPGQPLVNVGEEGLDQSGDSIFFGPKSKETIEVSAPEGSKLSYICLIHPWMQGQLRTRQ